MLLPQSVPAYISEMAPPKVRGGLNMLFHLMTVIGIFAASIINWSAPILDRSVLRLNCVMTIQHFGDP